MDLPTEDSDDRFLTPKVELDLDGHVGDDEDEVMDRNHPDWESIVRDLVSRIRVLEGHVIGQPSLAQVLDKCNRLEKRLNAMTRDVDVKLAQIASTSAVEGKVTEVAGFAIGKNAEKGKWARGQPDPETDWSDDGVDEEDCDAWHPYAHDGNEDEDSELESSDNDNDAPSNSTTLTTKGGRAKSSTPSTTTRSSSTRKNSPQFQCKVCSPVVRFSDEVGLAKHYTRSHPIVDVSPALVANSLLETQTQTGFHMEVEPHSSSPPAKQTKSHPKKKGAFQPTEKRTCPQCNKQFLRIRLMEIHILERHSDPPRRPVSCDLCDKSFQSQERAKQHQRQSHGGVTKTLSLLCRQRIPPAPGGPRRPPLLPCPDGCGKSFKMRKHLNSHLISCRKIKPYQCDECGASFGFANVLATHKKFVHGGKGKEEKAECIECGAVVQKRSMKGHMEVHERERRYSCQICGMKFKTEPALKRHSQSHSGERAFVCSYEGCGKAFLDRKVLSNHIGLHRRGRVGRRYEKGQEGGATVQ